MMLIKPYQPNKEVLEEWQMFGVNSRKNPKLI